MKLIQKATFSSSEIEIESEKIVQRTKSFFGSRRTEIPFESINLQSEIIRNHIEASISTLVVSFSIMAIASLVNHFRVYSNEDVFVILCGLILILAIAFRILQSYYKKQIVIPTLGLGEIVIWLDQPNKATVDAFMIELKLAILRHYEKKSAGSF